MARRIMHEFRLFEISGVDNPAQVHAKMTIAKRADEYWKRDFTQDQRDHLASTGAALPDGSFPIANRSDLENAIHAVGRASDPGKAKAHIISRAKSLGATDLLPKDWVGKNVGSSDNGDQDMSTDTDKKVGELSNQIADLTKKLDAAEKSAAEAATTKAALAELTKQLETLKAAADPTKLAAEAEAKKKFDEAVKAEVEKQVAAEMTKRDELAKNDDTIEVDGKVMRKSQSKDPAMFDVLKAQIDQRTMDQLTKRAETELKHLPGDTVVKAKGLRAIAKMSKEDREAVETMLKAGDAAMKANMKTIGHDGGTEGSATADLQKLADAHAAEKKVSKSDAMVAVLNTDEGKALYAKSITEKPAGAN